MMKSGRSKKNNQNGLTLVGLIFVLATLAVFAIVAAKVFPTVSEFFAIKNAIVSAKSSSNSINEIRSAFDRQANIAYIESVTGKDLEIVQSHNGFDVSVAYPKQVNLVGPVSLLIEYETSTALQKAASRPIN
jgi:hypothetical protein